MCKVEREVKVMKKRVMSMLLALSMLSGCLVGCGSDKTESADKGEKVTLTVGIPQNMSVTDYDDNTLTKHLEETLNMDIEFEYFSSDASEYTKQLTLICSAGEKLPDVLWGFTGLARNTMNQFGEDGYFVDLTELIEEHAPNYKKRIKEVSKEERKIIVSRGTNAKDGCFYGMPTYTTSTVADYMQNMMAINQTWLDAVGMTAPKNVDELYNVLKAFKEKDPNGNGQTDELPILGVDIALYIINAFVYYDATNNFNVTDGKVWDPVTTDEYRQAMIYLNKLCKEGLFNNLNLTAKQSDIRTLISGEGKTAIVGIWCGHGSRQTNTNTEVLDQYVGLDVLGDATGRGGYGVREPNYLVYAGFITKDCKNQEAAMRFLDAFYTDEIATWLRHGEKGVDWEEGEGESYYRTKSHIKVINGQAYFEGNVTWASTGTTWMTPENNLAIAASGNDRDAEVGRICLENFDIMTKFKRPEELAVYLIYSDEEQDVKDKVEGTYDSYVREARSLFINGTLDPNNDNDWNTYLKTVEEAGGSELLKVYQSAYDSTYKK